MLIRKYMIKLSMMGRFDRLIFLLGENMKRIIQKILPYLLTLEIIFTSIISCKITVYAADFVARDIIEAVEYGIEYNDWNPFWDFLYSTGDGLMYMYSQMGAIVTKNFQAWVNNNKALESLAETVPTPAKKEGENIVFTKELMAQLKAILDEYAKEENTKEENGGFYLLPTTNISDVPVDRFINSQQFRTFRNIVIEKGCLVVRVRYGAPIRFVDPFSDPDHPILLIGDLSNLNRLKEYPYMPVSSSFFCVNDWKTHSYRVQTFPEQDKIYTSCSDGIDYETGINSNLYSESGYMNWDFANHGSLSENFTLYSTTGEYIRVFVSQNAAKNYSVGKRSVYYTEKYYNYVPEDLSVSIDDLQKSVDDLQKVIDELLKQIGDNTSEKEIMDLLKQILEELHNQQGGGGGGGGGGGDVTVDIDLTQTNSWLSKIYQMLKNISDKLAHFRDDFSFFVEDFKNMFPDVGTGESTSWLQEQLDEIIKLLKSIKRWTAVDTVIDGVDALADWLDLIKDVIKDAKEGAGSAVAAIAGTVGDSVDMMSQKFPFSVPWDILFFISVMSAEPQVPHFEIPFNIELSALDITIDYTMELDFEQLQWLSDLSRLLLSMTYAVGLLKMTAGITSVGKEE